MHSEVLIQMWRQLRCQWLELETDRLMSIPAISSKAAVQHINHYSRFFSSEQFLEEIKDA